MDRLFVGMSKDALHDLLLWTTSAWDDPFLDGDGSVYDSKNQIEIIYAVDGQKMFYVFAGVSRGLTNKSYGNGSLHSWHTTLSSARAEVASIIRSRMLDREGNRSGRKPGQKTSINDSGAQTVTKPEGRLSNDLPVKTERKREAPIID